MQDRPGATKKFQYCMGKCAGARLDSIARSLSLSPSPLFELLYTRAMLKWPGLMRFDRLRCMQILFEFEEQNKNGMPKFIPLHFNVYSSYNNHT